MSTMTHNLRLQPRWTATATAVGTAAAMVLRTRGVGGFATCSNRVGGIDGASEPGRASLRRDDT